MKPCGHSIAGEKGAADDLARSVYDTAANCETISHNVIANRGRRSRSIYSIIYIMGTNDIAYATADLAICCQTSRKTVLRRVACHVCRHEWRVPLDVLKVIDRDGRILVTR